MPTTKNIREYPIDPWSDLIAYTHRYCLLSGNCSITHYIRKEKLNDSLRYWVNQKSLYKLLRATMVSDLPGNHFFSLMNINQRDYIIKVAFLVSRHRGDMLAVADSMQAPLSTVRYRCGTRQQLRWVMWQIWLISSDYELLVDAAKKC